jgi:homoserine dehydrogenase
VLGQHHISISSVLQQETANPDGTVPLVIMTHETTEGATRKACAEINQLKSVRGKTVRMWVRD